MNQKDQNTRVRFAPSPTGALHLGGARTAIYNWLFARSTGGQFLLRIEDTDRERSKEAFVDQILDSLRWLGLDWDEEPVYQSRRLKLYQEAVTQLLENDRAYRCFCTAEELAEQRRQAGNSAAAFRYSGKCRHLSQEEIDRNLQAGKPFALRFRVPEGKVSWNDRIRGTVTIDNAELDDFVIQRSSGIPTYQMAVVVDDVDMGITHVIRGEDHISNTSKQINLYRALERDEPEFAHLPLLLGADGKRLSKRHGATGVDEYRAQGYPQAAVFNFLALLGWTPKDGNEVLSHDEMIQRFHLEDISKKGAVLSPKKLDWISGEHITRMETEDLYERILPLLQQIDLVDKEPDAAEQKYIRHFVDLMKSRMRTFQQFAELGGYFFKEPAGYDTKAAAKNWKNTEVNDRVRKLREELRQLESWDAESIESTLRSTAEQISCSAAKLIHPLRLAVSGFGIGPGIFELLVALGKDTVLRRVDRALEKLPITQ